jgi:hypothetical protein
VPPLLYRNDGARDGQWAPLQITITRTERRKDWGVASQVWSPEKDRLGGQTGIWLWQNKWQLVAFARAVSASFYSDICS